MRKGMRFLLNMLGALLMASALAFDLAPAPAVKPMATDLFGYGYQLIARTFASVSADRITVTVLFVAGMWLCSRYLFRKPKETGFGEYALSVFLGGMMLLCTAVRTQDTIAVLWKNLFQIPKALLCFAGLTLMFLLLMRAMREGVAWIEKNQKNTCLGRLDAQSKPWMIFVIISLCWIPQIAVRYPGVLMWDSYMQIKQFVGEAERWANHPPFGTWLYGMIAVLGQRLDHKNLVYFLFTLAMRSMHSCAHIFFASDEAPARAGVDTFGCTGDICCFAVLRRMADGHC